MKNIKQLPALFLLVVIGIAGCKKDNSSSEHNHSGTVSNSRYPEMVNDGRIIIDTMKSSPERYAMAVIDGTHLHISYYSPGVKERVIWGGLVQYGKIWVTGAHMATTLEINKPVKIQDKIIKPGKYAFFTIPDKNIWTIVLNSDAEQHLADHYDQAKDIARFTVDPAWDNKFTPRLTYGVIEHPKGGVITMEWEKLKIMLPFETLP